MIRISFLASAIALVGCASLPTDKTPSKSYRGQVPIASFQGYEPYARVKSGRIDSFVAFRPDGVLTSSLGCTLYSATFGFDDQSRLVLSGHSDGIAVTNSARLCDPDLLETESALWTFLNARPTATGWTDDGLLLKTGGRLLVMKAVADVLDDDVKMKVND